MWEFSPWYVAGTSKPQLPHLIVFKESIWLRGGESHYSLLMGWKQRGTATHTALFPSPHRPQPHASSRGCPCFSQHQSRSPHPQKGVTREATLGLTGCLETRLRLTSRVPGCAVASPLLTHAPLPPAAPASGPPPPGTPAPCSPQTACTRWHCCPAGECGWQSSSCSGRCSAASGAASGQKAWLCRPGMLPSCPGAHALEMALAASWWGTTTRAPPGAEKGIHARSGAPEGRCKHKCRSKVTGWKGSSRRHMFLPHEHIPLRPRFKSQIQDAPKRLGGTCALDLILQEWYDKIHFMARDTDVQRIKRTPRNHVAKAVFKPMSMQLQFTFFKRSHFIY